jgi:hypothetical protein
MPGPASLDVGCDQRIADAGGHRIRALLADLADAATVRYLFYGHGNGIMLVHSATAPSAVLRTLPALEVPLWRRACRPPGQRAAR